jgi:hypothetical protein
LKRGKNDETGTKIAKFISIKRNYVFRQVLCSIFLVCNIFFTPFIHNFCIFAYFFEKILEILVLCFLKKKMVTVFKMELPTQQKRKSEDFSEEQNRKRSV